MVHGPRATRYRVDNPNLAGWVEDSAGAAIVLAVAPAGYGKSTVLHVLHERMREAGLAVAWLALGPEDDDLGRFCARLLEAIGANRDDTPAPATLLDSSAAGAQLAQRLVDALARPPQPVALFIDDFDHVAAPALLALVQRALETMSSDVRLFIASRTQPALKLLRWKAQGRLLQIGVHELAFDHEQAEEFLNRRHALGLTPQQVQRLLLSSEGWATGLQLAALAMEATADRPGFVERFCAADADIGGYLMQEVFEALPDPLRRFLLDTSVLDQLVPTVCNAVAGIDDAAALLRELERRNLFVQRDVQQPEQHRCHPLFRDFLRQRLHGDDPSRAAWLHGRASDWHRRHGEVEPAIEHAIEQGRCGGGFEGATALLELHAWPTLLAGQLTTVTRWLLALPPQERAPRLQFALGWALALQHRYAEAEALVDELRRQPALQAEPDLRVLAPMTLALVDRFDECEQALSVVPESAYDASASGCTLHNVRAYVHLVAQRWSEALADARAGRRGFAALGSRYGEAFSVGIEAQALLAQGEADRALALLQSAHEDMVRHAGADSVCSVHVGVTLAEALVERGDFDAAFALLQPHAQLVRATGTVDTIIVCHRLLARLHARAGDHPAAMQAVQSAAELGQRLGLARIAAAMRLEAHHLAQCRFDAGLLDRLPAAPPDDPVWVRFTGRLAPGNDVEQPLLTRLRVRLRSAAPAQALCEIDAALADAVPRGRSRLALRLKLLRAVAQAALGDGAAALAALAALLDSAGPACGAGALLDEGPALRALCERLARSGGVPMQALLARVLDDAASAAAARSPVVAPAPVAPPIAAPTEPLSERETEVLRCLVEGLPNKRIAQRLHVSEPTVKFHLRNINAKLGARNRTHAVFIARQSGMLG